MTEPEGEWAHEARPTRMGEKFKHRLEVIRGSIVRAPWIVIVPALLFTVSCALGLWGMLRAANEQEADSRDQAHRAAKAAGDLYLHNIKASLLPELQLAYVIRNQPSVPTLLNNWEKLLPPLWSQAVDGTLSISMVTQNTVAAVYPPTQRNRQQYLGRNVFDPVAPPFPLFPYALQFPNTTMIGPVSDGTSYLFYLALPIWFANSTQNETWGANTTVRSCVIGGQDRCWDATTKTKLWGALVLEIDNFRLDAALGSPIAQLVANGYKAQSSWYDLGTASDVIIPMPDGSMPEPCTLGKCMSNAIRTTYTDYNVWVTITLWPGSGTWAPAYKTPLIVVIVVTSFCLAFFCFLLLLSWFENKALIERLLPSRTLKQLRAQWEWNADSAWASIQHIEQDTPAQHMLDVIQCNMTGKEPNIAQLLAVQSALHKGLDIYRPAVQELGTRMQEAPGMDDEVREALMAQLVGVDVFNRNSQHYSRFGSNVQPTGSTQTTACIGEEDRPSIGPVSPAGYVNRRSKALGPDSISYLRSSEAQPTVHRLSAEVEPERLSGGSHGIRWSLNGGRTSSGGLGRGGRAAPGRTSTDGSTSLGAGLASLFTRKKPTSDDGVADRNRVRFDPKLPEDPVLAPVEETNDEGMSSPLANSRQMAIEARQAVNELPAGGSQADHQLTEAVGNALVLLINGCTDPNGWASCEHCTRRSNDVERCASSRISPPRSDSAKAHHPMGPDCSHDGDGCADELQHHPHSEEVFSGSIVITGMTATISGPDTLEESAQACKGCLSVHRAVPDRLLQVLGQSDSWAYDPFVLEDVTCGRPLSVLGFWIMHRSGLIQTFALNEVKLARFMQHVEAGYPATNPYHNARHAASVLQMYHMLLTRGGLVPGYCDALTMLTCLLSAIVHDLEHRGCNNDYLVNAQDELAMRYNDRSPMENHHLAAAWSLLKRPDLNFLQGLPKMDLLKLRKLMIDLVLATDMKQHFALMGQFSALHGSSNPVPDISTISGSRENSFHRGRGNSGEAATVGHVMQPLSDNDWITSLQIALKCADLGHMAAPLHVHLHWVQSLEQEFFLQGDKERAAGLPISPLCDRHTEGVMKSQVGFFQFVVMPLFSTFARRFRDAQPLVRLVMSNYRHWTQGSELVPDNGRPAQPTNIHRSAARAISRSNLAGHDPADQRQGGMARSHGSQVSSGSHQAVSASHSSRVFLRMSQHSAGTPQSPTPSEHHHHTLMTRTSLGRPSSMMDSPRERSVHNGLGGGSVQGV